MSSARSESLLPRCVARIDPDALRHNFRYLRSRLSAGGRVAAVLKADAYGHGLRRVASILAGETDLFAVANLAEARELRGALEEVGAAAAVLILGPALPWEREGVVAEGFEAIVSDRDEALSYAEAGRKVGRRAQLHLAVDTGMGRVGVWHESALELAREVAGLADLRGIGSHLPAADSDREWTEAVQLPAWLALEKAAREDELLREVPFHLLNSAGVLLYGERPELAGAFVRAGLALYGSSPLPEFQNALRPVMTLATAITLIREVPAGRGVSYGRTFVTPRPMRIATLAAGYGDGYPRHLSGNAEVLIGGRRCPVLGRVTMDQLLVDVSAVPEARAGDEAVLVGRQGEEEVLMAELADRAGTIAWEIFTRIPPRVPRQLRCSLRLPPVGG